MSAFLPGAVGGRRPARVWAVRRLVVCQTAARRGAAAPSSIHSATAWCQCARSWSAAAWAVTAPLWGMLARSWLRAWSRASRTGAHLSARQARRWARTAAAQRRSASESRWLVWGVRVSREGGVGYCGHERSGPPGQRGRLRRGGLAGRGPRGRRGGRDRCGGRAVVCSPSRRRGSGTARSGRLPTGRSPARSPLRLAPGPGAGGYWSGVAVTVSGSSSSRVGRWQAVVSGVVVGDPVVGVGAGRDQVCDVAAAFDVVEHGVFPRPGGFVGFGAGGEFSVEPRSDRSAD